MNPFIALALGAVMGGVLASGGEPKKEVTGRSGGVAGSDAMNRKTE